MTGDLTVGRMANFEQDELWSPSQRARSWLVIGIAALLIDFVLVIAITALELKHWAKEGLTPDVIVGYLAIVPQACVFLAWLKLARDAADRGLWKSSAGLFASYLLACLIGVALIEGLPRGWIIGINVVTAVGVIGLLAFSLSKRPQFDQPAVAQSVVEIPPAASEEEDSSGCMFHIVGALALFALKAFVRQINRGLPNIDLGLDGWSILLGAVVLVFGTGFLLWAATAKIRLRHKLGGLAAVVGGWELLAMLVHLGMLAGGVYLLTAAAMANPQLDENDIDKLLDPWLMRATVVSAACQGLWIVLAAALFTSLWLRPETDWRQSFGAETSAARFAG